MWIKKRGRLGDGRRSLRWRRGPSLSSDQILGLVAPVVSLASRSEARVKCALVGSELRLNWLAPEPAAGPTAANSFSSFAAEGPEGVPALSETARAGGWFSPCVWWRP